MNAPIAMPTGQRMRGVIDAAIVAGTHKVLAGYKPYAKCAKQRARRAKALQKEAAEAAEGQRHVTALLSVPPARVTRTSD